MTATQSRPFIQTLRSLHACSEAVTWAEDYPSAQKAWNECQRGDWMLWIIGRTINCEPWSDGRKLLLACCLDCAETVKHLWPSSQKKNIEVAVSVLRDWIAGKATVEQAKQARNDLYAAYSAAAYSAYYSAYSAAYSAYAAAYSAAYAYSAYAAYAAAAAYARTKTLAQCADIVRRHYPKPPRVRVLTEPTI